MGFFRKGIIVGCIFVWATGCNNEPTGSPDKPVGVAKVDTKSEDGLPSAIIDGVKIQLLSVAIDQPESMRSGRKKRLDAPRFVVWFQVENQTSTKKVDYLTYSSVRSTLDSSRLSLRDNYGNVYKADSLEMGNIVGGSRSKAIEPGKSIVDVLLFEVPTPARRPSGTRNGRARPSC